MAKPNLHPSYCFGCRKDLETIVEMGRSDYVYVCHGCRNYYVGAAWPGRCPVCGDSPGHQQYIKTLDPGEAVPGEMCPDCLGKQAVMDQAVKDGGIRFQCIGCGKDGVFAASTPFAQRIREETKKPPPQDVFVQIKACPQCPPPEVTSEDGVADNVTDNRKADDPVHIADADLDGLVDDILST